MSRKPSFEYPELLSAMFECMGEGMYAIDTEGHVLLINPSASTILGYPPDELVGKVMHDTTHYKHKNGSPFPKSDCAGFRVITRGETVTVEEDFFIRKDGSFVPVSYTSSPIHQHGKIIGAVVAFQDLTTRLEQESALHKAEERLRLVYRASVLGTWEWEVASDMLYLSPEFAQIVGLSALTQISLSDFVRSKIFYDSDRRLLETTLRNTMKANKELKAEFRIRRGQEVRWVLIAGKSYENFGKPTVLGVMIDTTELKQQRGAQGSQSV